MHPFFISSLLIKLSFLLQVLESLQAAGQDHIIKIYGYEQDSKRILLLMELGDVDLASVLKSRKKKSNNLDENHVRLYWQQMLEAVQVIHQVGQTSSCSNNNKKKRTI